MVLVGDAACFVDPVFSSGVHLATYSALLAARSINSVLAQEVDEATAFREFERRYRREYAVYYEFLTAFYDMNSDEESYFWSAKTITDNTSTELESFVELIGGVSSSEAPPRAERFKNRSSEFSKAVDELVANNEQDMLPILKSSIVHHAMQEGTRVQASAILGENALPEEALFEDGLVPSADGMGWSRPE
jgi:halogenation protein CepH